MRQHRLVAPGHDRPDLAANCAQQDLAGEHCSLVGVDVRVGAIAGHHRRIGNDLVVEIGVHVERYCDRGLRVDRAQPPQELPLSVLEALGDHRTVQVQHDPVEPAASHRLADRVCNVLVGRVLDRATRRRAGGDRQDDFRPFALGKIEIGAEPGAGAMIGADRRFAIKRPRAATEPCERRRHRRKSVGFVLHHCDQQSHDPCSLLSRGSR